MFAQKLDKIIKSSNKIVDLSTRLKFISEKILKIIDNYKIYSFNILNDITNTEIKDEEIFKKYVKNNNYFLEDYVEPIFTNYRKEYTKNIVNKNTATIFIDDITMLTTTSNDQDICLIEPVVKEIIQEDFINYNSINEKITSYLHSTDKNYLSNIANHLQVSSSIVLLTVLYFNNQYIIEVTSDNFYNTDLIIKLN